MDHPNGGPAFPTGSVSQNQATGETIVHQPIGGMSKRELFAKDAMTGMLANSDNDGSQEPVLRALFRDRRLVRDYAELAYDVADALLDGGQPRPVPAPAFPEFAVYGATDEQKDALRTLHTRTWFEQLPADLRTYVTDAMNAIARAEAGEDDIPF